MKNVTNLGHVEKKKIPKKINKHNKFQEYFNDHNEKQNMLQISRMPSIHIWQNHKLERKQNTTSPKIPMTMKKEISCCELL